MLLKGEGEHADNIMGGAEWSTLSHDAFPGKVFDFMLSNPPYGKSWKKDLEAMGGKKEMNDPRFQVTTRRGVVAGHALQRRPDAVSGQHGQQDEPRHAPGQPHRPGAQRLLAVHRRCRPGESNIRRWLFENDWVEAIVALPLNLFYNTGIATYVWLLSNRKAPERAGQGAADRCQRLVRTPAQESGKEELHHGSEPTSSGDGGLRRIWRRANTPRCLPMRPLATGSSRVERPLRLHSRLTPGGDRKRCDGLGRREIRESALDAVRRRAAGRFRPRAAQMEKRLAGRVGQCRKTPRRR